MLEKGWLGVIFEPKREEVTEMCEELHNEQLYLLKTVFQ